MSNTTLHRSNMGVAPEPDPDGGLDLRIAHVLAPGRAGGVESVVRMLTAGLVSRGARVTVLAVTGPEGVPEGLAVPLEASGVELERVVLPHRAYFREFRTVAAWLRHHRPDVCHTHGYRADVVAGTAARRVGIPLVSTLHGFTGGGWKNRFYERLQLRALRPYDAVIAVSRPIRDRLPGLGFRPERVHFIPNAWAGGDARPDRAGARAALGLPPDAKVVGWVGRLSHEKGPGVMLDALAALDDPGVVLSMIGDGALRPGLVERTRALGLEDRVRWHGFHPEAARLYPAFDVFALSSHTEGTPIALFEAMAAGVPIVATRVGGVPDVLGSEEAILVPPGSASGLAAGLAALLGEPERRAALSRRARERLRTAYAPEPWVGRHLELYTALARARGAVSR